MKQNIYDDEAFFRGYADLRANPGSLNGLMEQSALRALATAGALPELSPR